MLCWFSKLYPRGLKRIYSGFDPHRGAVWSDPFCLQFSLLFMIHFRGRREMVAVRMLRMIIANFECSKM